MYSDLFGTRGSLAYTWRSQLIYDDEAMTLRVKFVGAIEVGTSVGAGGATVIPKDRGVGAFISAAAAAANVGSGEAGKIVDGMNGRPSTYKDMMRSAGDKAIEANQHSKGSSRDLPTEKKAEEDKAMHTTKVLRQIAKSSTGIVIRAPTGEPMIQTTVRCQDKSGQNAVTNTAIRLPSPFLKYRQLRFRHPYPRESIG